jgi:mandelate racemase
VRAARGAIPDDVEVMVDFNQCLPGDEAIRRGRALDGEGVYWIEEPVRADDFGTCGRVAANVATPLQIGENFNGVFEMQEAVRVNTSDFVMPDVQRIGGVTGWLRAAAIAQAAGQADVESPLHRGERSSHGSDPHPSLARIPRPGRLATGAAGEGG